MSNQWEQFKACNFRNGRNICIKATCAYGSTKIMIQMLDLYIFHLYVFSCFPDKLFRKEIWSTTLFKIWFLQYLIYRHQKDIKCCMYIHLFLLFYWTLQWFSVVKYTHTKIGYVRGSCRRCSIEKVFLKILRI